MSNLKYQNLKNKFKKLKWKYAWYQGIIFVILLPLIFVFFFPYCYLRKFILKKLKKKPRIIWGPVSIFPIQYNSLASRLFDYPSDTLVYWVPEIIDKNFFDYNLEKIFQNPRFYPLLPNLWVFLWALLKYDIFQFFFSGGFLFQVWPTSRLELPLLKLLGKKIIVSAYGSDVRTEEITRKSRKFNAYFDFSHQEVLKLYGSDENIKRQINHMAKYADLTLSIGCLNDYLPKARKDVFYWAIDLSKYRPLYQTNNKKIKIVHSTNHPKYKGTRFFIGVCQRLKKEGYPIEFIFIKNLKNEKATEIYREADIIAVQLLTGWHGYTSVEAMALGKPVLCYIAKKEWLPDWIECPIVNTNPDNLYENLLMLIKDKSLRVELGKKGRKYVEEVYSLEKVGARFDKIYQEIW